MNNSTHWMHKVILEELGLPRDLPEDHEMRLKAEAAAARIARDFPAMMLQEQK